MTKYLECSGEINEETKTIEVTPHHNSTNTPVTNNTNITQTLRDIKYVHAVVHKSNESNSLMKGNLTGKLMGNFKETPLPLPIIIAGPTVIVFNFIFICVAYKFHSIQLDRKVLNNHCQRCHDRNTSLSSHLLSSDHQSCQLDSTLDRGWRENLTSRHETCAKTSSKTYSDQDFRNNIRRHSFPL
jgi:hypothetical protein